MTMISKGTNSVDLREAAARTERFPAAKLVELGEAPTDKEEPGLGDPWEVSPGDGGELLAPEAPGCDGLVGGTVVTGELSGVFPGLDPPLGDAEDMVGEGSTRFSTAVAVPELQATFPPRTTVQVSPVTRTSVAT